jgi:serine protease Do
MGSASPRPLLRLLTVAAFFALPLPFVSAQLDDPLDMTEEERELAYEELDRDVSALERQGNLLRRVIRLATPTVVHIEAAKPSRVSYSRRSREEEGAGVILEIGGGTYVLTNRHVVDSAPLEQVDLRLADGRLIHPSRVVTDRLTDIALLAVEADNLVPARVGDSDLVDIGDFVLAVGSPFGLSHSVTYGIISAKGRRDLQLGDGSIRYQDFLQTDAAINPGNSGGPLLNLRGEVIGINTAIASSSGGSEGIGFTIPINMAVEVARQLVEEGRTVRAYLGVHLDDDFGPEKAAELGLPRLQGALVSGVTRNTPAEKAAMKKNDVVLEFDGKRIEDDEHLIKVVGFTPIGKEVEVVIYRFGELIRLKVTVDDRSKYESDG